MCFVNSDVPVRFWKLQVPARKKICNLTCTSRVSCSKHFMTCNRMFFGPFPQTDLPWQAPVAMSPQGWGHSMQGFMSVKVWKHRSKLRASLGNLENVTNQKM